MTLLTILMLFRGLVGFAADSDQEKFFETEVRPLLAQHCFECHREKKKQGDLRLDRKRDVFAASPSGQAVVPGKLNESRLWQVVQYSEFDTQMPPTGKLSAEKLEIFRKWIETGAFWPEEVATSSSTKSSEIPHQADGTIDYLKAIEDHWAYQVVQEPKAPEVSDASPQLSNIDRFLIAKLTEQGLRMSDPTSPQKLIRRLSFDLRGLPPTYAEVQEFEKNASPTAFAALVDQYLADPAYGERWGRYWLDIARYADTKGYVFTENRFYPYSYTYRDYVIDAFNSDKPYDSFIMEQLAADHLGFSEQDPRLAALGFLTIGPRFLNRTPDIIDDRIDVVTRGLMGMTLGCARCHDHKFDPLPTADYYSMYGVFDSSYEPELPPLRGEIAQNAPGYTEFATELNKREQELRSYLETAHQELLTKAMNELDDYFPAAVKSLGILTAETELTQKHGALRDRLTAHWKNTIERMAKAQHPVFLPSARLLTLKPEELPNQLTAILAELDQNEQIPDFLIQKLRAAQPSTKLAVVDVYVQVLVDVREEWKALLAEKPDSTVLADPAREQVRQVLFGPGSLSDLAAGDYSPLFERDNRDQVAKLKKKIDEWHASSPAAPPRSMVLFDKADLASPVIFIRGNNGRRGERVPRRGPQILNPSPDAIFKETSGRKELAEQIVSKQNPLTARVIVNRIWGYHFGSPLVDSSGDFGLRTESPLHQDLLDSLAWSLMHQHNWSLKGLHREILLSQAWQQQSLDRPEARQLDPENDLYWKQNRQRIDFEAMRDAMLSVAGQLDTVIGGRPVDIEKKPFPKRRTVYAFIDRNNPSGLLRTFDFPTPNSSSPGRSETTVPQQALFGMNSEFSDEIANALAKEVANSASTPIEQALEIVRRAYRRDATPAEQDAIANYLVTGTLEELAQGLFLSNEFFFID